MCIWENIYRFYSIEIDVDAGQDWDILDVNKGLYISLGFYALTKYIFIFISLFWTCLLAEVKKQQHFVTAGLDLLEGDIENVQVS